MAINAGGRWGASRRALRFGSRREVAFANYQVAFTLCNRATHFYKPCDTSGPISVALYSVPAGGPRKKRLLRPGRTALRRRRREEASGWEAPTAAPRAKAGAEVGNERGSQAWRTQTCMVPSCYSEEAALAPHLEDSPSELGLGIRGGHFTRRGAIRVQWELSFQHPRPNGLPKCQQNPPTRGLVGSLR